MPQLSLPHDRQGMRGDVSHQSWRSEGKGELAAGMCALHKTERQQAAYCMCYSACSSEDSLGSLQVLAYHQKWHFLLSFFVWLERSLNDDVLTDDCRQGRAGTQRFALSRLSPLSEMGIDHAAVAAVTSSTRTGSPAVMLRGSHRGKPSQDAIASRQANQQLS